MNQKQAKELVRSRLSDKRYEHTLNVKKMAVRLAKRYGVDEDKAALAALLHDSAKEISKDEMRGTDAAVSPVCRGRGRAACLRLARHLCGHPRPHPVGRGG